MLTAAQLSTKHFVTRASRGGAREEFRPRLAIAPGWRVPEILIFERREDSVDEGA
jgi:hypothetical protein